MPTLKTRAERNVFWRQQVSAWRASGETQQRFCQRHDLSYTKFQYWQRKFAAEPKTQQPTPTRFVAVHHQRSEESGGLVLTLPGGAELRGITAENLAVVERLLSIA